MTTTTLSTPVLTSLTLTRRAQTITAAYNAAGDSVVEAGGTSRVKVLNFQSTQWPIEYRVNSGAWVELSERDSADLVIDLATETLKLRRSRNAPASMVVDLELYSKPGSTFEAGGSPVAPLNSLVSGAGISAVPAQASVAGAVRQALARSSNPGTIVSDFVGTKWTAAGGGAVTGTPTIVTDYTGYDAAGARTGVVSRTGQAATMRVTPTATGDAVRLAFGAVNVPLNGRIGLWVHCANVTGYDTGVGPTAGRIRLDISTNAASIGNGARVGWTIEGQLREGWNWLKFVQKGSNFNSATNAQVGANVFTGAHPYGIEVTTLGTGADSEIASANARSLMITFVSCTGWVITLDSLWTGFSSRAVVVPGCDQAAQSCVDIALPLFAQYGWKGYVCSPRGVLANPTTATYADMVADASYADMVSARTTYPVLGTLYDAGWDVINHSWTHRSLGYLTSAGEIQMEIERSRAWLVGSAMPRGGEFYASPASNSSRLSEAVVSGCGMALQRHGKKINNSLTPWGFDNPGYLGSHDIGNATTGQSLAILQNVLDNCERYGDVYWPFWHVIRTLGDPGDASGIYAVDNLNIYASNWRAFMVHIRAREQAGGVVVLSPSQLYYGT